MSLTYGDFLRDTGMQLALDAKPDWSALADEWFANLPEGTEFTSEDLVSNIGLPMTAEPGVNRNNAVGAKIRSLASKSEEVGFRKTVRITSHSRRVVVWRKK
jgi:hypothetical protein